jgi:hypothetical protein
MSISLSEIIKKEEITCDALETAQAITSNGLFIGKTLFLAVQNLGRNKDEFEVVEPSWSGHKGEIKRTRAAAKVAFWIRKLFSHLKQEFLFDELIKMIAPALEVVRDDKPFKGGWVAGLYTRKSQSGNVPHWEKKSFLTAHAAALRLLQALAYQVRQSLRSNATHDHAVVRKNVFRFTRSSPVRLAKRVNRFTWKLRCSLEGLSAECFDKIIAEANWETTRAKGMSPAALRAISSWARSNFAPERDEIWQVLQEELALSSIQSSQELGVDCEEVARPVKESEKSEGIDRMEKTGVTGDMPNTGKKIKEPSPDALRAYRSLIATGKTQTELADMLTDKLGRPIDQGTVSRWLKQVKTFFKDGNVLPDLPEPSRRETPMNPRKLDLGARQDRLAKRQRDKSKE